MIRPAFYCTLLLAACAGCGGPASTVQGTVTIDGEVARQGTVQFHPVEDGPTAYGLISEDGSYAIRVGQGDLSDPNAGDLPTGEYIVTVVVNMPSRPDEEEGAAAPPKPGARLSAEKYGHKDSSGLRHTVKPGRNVIPLDLEGRSADEDATEAVETEDVPAIEPPAEASQPGAEAAPAERASDGETAPPTEPSPGPAPGAAPAETSDPPAAAVEKTQ